jgi:peptide/nickel transport system substrate-binding protein
MIVYSIDVGGIVTKILRKNGPGLVLTALMGATLACGGGDRGGSATAELPSTTENQINPMSRDQVQDGGTLTWPLLQIPSNFNYHHLDGTLKDNAEVMEALLPNTFRSDASGTPHWNADYLASEPSMTIEPKQVITYTIHPEAAWDDGTPITWEDFHWQWRASNGQDQAYQISSSNGYSDIESVERGADDREVVVTYARRYADWQAVFNPIFPASTNRDPQVFNQGWREQPRVTAGPFRFEGINQTTKTITLVRNENWWGEPARLDRIVYRVLEATAQIDALANGEIDFFDIGPDANMYNRARGIAGVEIRSAGGPNFRHVTINGTSPNLRDVRVRQALAMGIDRTAIARALLGPLGVSPEPLNNHIFMANQAGYRDNSGEVGQFNPERAGQLLDEAGWVLEGAVRRKDDRPLEITMVIPSGVATSRQESELMQNMLGQIGVRLRINTVPSPDFFERYIIPGEYDFTVFSWIGTPFPISSTASIYRQPTTDDDGELVIQQNFARVGSDEIDALYTQVTAELDRAAAVEIANRIDALIWQEVHSLTLYQRPELYATKVGLANIGAFGFAQPPVYQDIGWAQAE